jgi:hypothetical protein
MTRSKIPLAFAALFLSTFLTNASAMAQAASPNGGSATAPASGGLLRQNNITSTGATVPHPGVSQSNGPTHLDTSIDRQNEKIEKSICKGC